MQEAEKVKGRWYIFNIVNRDLWDGYPNKESALEACSAGLDDIVFIPDGMAEIIGKVDETKSVSHWVYDETANK